MLDNISFPEHGIYITPAENDLDIDQILALHKGDRLPEDTFGVYESVDREKWIFEAISRYAYPPVAPEVQHMTILAHGASIDTNRSTLYFGPPSKPLRFENINGHVKRNGLRIPLWLATGENPLGTI
jgi:hypothetical protein